MMMSTTSATSNTSATHTTHSNTIIITFICLEPFIHMTFKVLSRNNTGGTVALPVLHSEKVLNLTPEPNVVPA